jgi:hypothetical protein
VLYVPSLLEQSPPDNHSLYPPPPPQLPTVCFLFFCFFLLCGSDFDYLIMGVWQCVLPAGVEFYPSGLDANDSSTFPKSYPIVLTGNIFFPFILSAICLFHN